MDDELLRPDPESLLKVANETESKKGKLTIFFGAAPGVGKTYAMLQEAQNQKKEGVDIIVGYVEPHKRKETEALLAGLMVIASQKISYKGLELYEANLDAILQKKPSLVVMDELAHTNAPGSRHEKRFQDVEEILKAGIDVYSTLNVQHLESVNDLVFSITGIQVKETIPDGIFLSADEVKIIDLPAKELLKRLADGKVYIGEMAQRAVERFFTQGNLTALRELALRCITSRVDKEVDEYRRIKAIKDPWPVTDKLLVGLFSSPSAEYLVRSTFRFASELNAKWTALHVETERDKNMTEQEKGWLMKAMDLSKALGAEVVVVHGNDVTKEVVRYAENHNITKIILGKPHRFRTGFAFMWRMLKETKGMDIFWFSHELRKSFLPSRILFNPWKGLSWGFLWVVVAAGVGQLFRDYLSETNMLFLMLLPVVLVSIRFNRRTAVFSAALSVAVFDYLFVKPYYTFAVNDVQYFLSFAVFATIAFFLSSLASILRFQLKELRHSEAQSAALYDLTKDLLVAQDKEEVAKIIIRHVRSLIPCEAGIFFFGEQREIVFQKLSPAFVLDDKELAVVSWVYKNGQAAGPGTKTLREARAVYLPVKKEDVTQIVLGIKFMKKDSVLTEDIQNLLETIGRLGALALGEK
ncbi:MAG: sensor histidine kinase KdpD [Candidatus Omnitrophica bacterium]|nr:sensor histidine kinase KdpD [Candidatus Omnitrophota bacterium]